jgi:hypothetical protein
VGVRPRATTWIVVAGLAMALVGHRVFQHAGAVRVALLVAALMSLAGATAWRATRWRRAGGPSRRVEAAVTWTHLGCLVALVMLLTGTEAGIRWLGLDLDPSGELRFRRAFLAAGSVVLAASLLPALTAWWASRLHQDAGPRALGIGADRVMDAATTAFSVALAGAFLMIGGYVAAAHDRTLDASYFRTSSPGTAVQEIVRSMASPLRVLLFFPEVDPVKDELTDYFHALRAATDNVVVEAYDWLSQPTVAAEHDVRSDGTVILAYGDRRERFGVPTELAAARSVLRVVDGTVHQRLLELGRARRVAYLTTGHGELNDVVLPTGLSSPAQDGQRLVILRDVLGRMGYDVRDLGLGTGLADRIPGDATALLALGPQRPFLDEELRAVGSYLDRGGSLLLALEPESEFSLGPLRDRLGIDYRMVPLADDRTFVRQRGAASDRMLIITDRFTPHAAVTTASRAGAGSGVLLLGAGYLAEVEGVTTAERRFVIESMPSTFADLDGDLRFDEGTESRGNYPLAAAIEGTARDSADTMRGLVYADAQMFSDPVLASLGMNVAVLADGVRWLGREERFAGEVVSEEDVPIVHTSAENVAWFYGIILGAPALVLGLGVVRFTGPLGRRRRPT